MSPSHQIAFEHTTDHQDRTVLSVIGSVDLKTGPVLRDRIERTAEPGETLVLDLERVTFMDSPGLGTLIYCDRIQRERLGRLVMRNPTAPVRELFDTVRLANVIEIE
jgi:anti-anti-sigma factor